MSPQRGHLNTCWRLHIERLVGAHLVEVMTETIQLALLAAPVCRRLLLQLEGAVHAFMPPVPLRVSGLDTLVRDAELGPPHRQPGKSPEAVPSFRKQTSYRRTSVKKAANFRPETPNSIWFCPLSPLHASCSLLCCLPQAPSFLLPLPAF